MESGALSEVYGVTEEVKREAGRLFIGIVGGSVIHDDDRVAGRQQGDNCPYQYAPLVERGNDDEDAARIPKIHFLTASIWRVSNRFTGIPMWARRSSARMRRPARAT